jgi:hypothetical protein
MFTMRKYEILGFFIISLISIGLALLFWALPSSYFLDGVGPTTDSLWQIGKLMFFSISIYTLIEYFVFGREFENFIFAKAATLFIAPLIYIGASYILDMGMGNATFNNHIITYALAIIAGQYVSFYILRDGYYFRLMNGYAILGILLMMTVYITFGRTTDKFDNPIFHSMERYQTSIQGLR